MTLAVDHRSGHVGRADAGRLVELSRFYDCDLGRAGQTAGHFLFASVMTATMLVGIWCEERDHLVLFGDRYGQYQRQVAMLLPRLV